MNSKCEASENISSRSDSGDGDKTKKKRWIKEQYADFDHSGATFVTKLFYANAA